MAGHAIIAGLYMAGMFAGSHDAVVTRGAGAQHFVVIDLTNRRPNYRRVTGTAQGGSANMIGTDAASIGAVMTTDTGCRTDGAVVEQTTGENIKTAGDMAGIASRRRRDMLSGQSRGQYAVVTSGAFIG